MPQPDRGLGRGGLGHQDALGNSKILAGLLVLIAAALAWTHFCQVGSLHLNLVLSAVLGQLAGAAIGVVAAVMGVAGGELLIPTIVLLFAVDIKFAGPLSLAVSLLTTLVAFARYSQDESFTVLRRDKNCVIAMTVGSITGTIIGGLDRQMFILTGDGRRPWRDVSRSLTCRSASGQQSARSQGGEVWDG
ncbi:TSUP family transporter [Lapillicoccus sp.]|uniref:TSUP family transporter n=1 Tax=Lapillicoccus sp. TaxID=1909287 RepID=UPI003983D7FE